MIGSLEVIRIDARRVFLALTVVAAVLVAAHLLLLMITVTTGHDHIFGIVPLFDLDAERNVPSFFSGLLFLVNGLLLWFVAQRPPTSRRSRVWYVLSTVFVFLSYDEVFGVHERLTEPLREALHTTSFLYYPWIVAYAAPLLALGVWFIPAWRRLDGRARTRLTVAAALFFLGVILFEMIGGAYDERFGHRRSLGWGLLVAAEESLEMAGLIVLTRALLGLLSASAVAIDDPSAPAAGLETGYGAGLR